MGDLWCCPRVLISRLDWRNWLNAENHLQMKIEFLLHSENSVKGKLMLRFCIAKMILENVQGFIHIGAKAKATSLPDGFIENPF